MPASRSLAPATGAAAPMPISLLPPEAAAAPVELDPFAFSELYRAAPDSFEDDSVLINSNTGEELTLDEVNAAVAWRRETAEKLRQLPVGPRF
mgnify:CR=1 FL=1